MKVLSLIALMLIPYFSLTAQGDKNLVSEDFKMVDARVSANLPQAADLSKLQNARPLSELNKNDRAEAYPFLTEDGLRLYFTQEVDGGAHIMLAERPDTESPFGAAVAKSFNVKNFVDLFEIIVFSISVLL